MPGGAARPYKGLRLQGFEGAKHGGLQGFEGAKQQLRRVEKAFGAWKVLPRNSGCGRRSAAGVATARLHTCGGPGRRPALAGATGRVGGFWCLCDLF